MAKVASAKAAQFPLKELVAQIEKATGKSRRELSVDMGYKNQDTVSNLISLEERGTPAPKKLLNRLEQYYKKEVTGEQEFDVSDAAYHKKLLEENHMMKAALRVVLTMIATREAKEKGTKIDFELESLQIQIESVAGRMPWKL